MASSSLPLSLPSPSLTRSWEHDVFPSFHGPDVRKGFLSHINKEFERKGITPFIDNEIPRGESIAPELKRAIQESKIAIVLLSTKYASSSWCLNELVEVMRKVEGQKVLTIFYEVDPTDIKKQTGDFGKVFEETCQGKTKEKTETWRKALEGVATIAGYDSRKWNNEAAMIEEIATEISKTLNHLAPSSDMDRLPGIGVHMERMQPLLRLDLENEVRMIGILGPPGVGKSTIARFLFNQLSNSFQLRAIMVNIKGNYQRKLSKCLDEYSAQLQLQNQMLSSMINHKETMIPHLGVAQERLKDRRVLLVLDDVDGLAQLDALAGGIRWFGPGSRIIIATEDQKILNDHGINHVYKVDDVEALQLFCMHAFGQKFPYDGFEELAQEVTELSGKHPFGLRVMGSYFRGMSKDYWTRALQKLRKRLNGEIKSVLKFSYDDLSVEDKELFLHIACFFNYQEVEKVEEHLAKKFTDVRQRLKDFVKKSLISIDRISRIEMDSLLAQLGKEIVHEQSLEPEERQFLVDHKDIVGVLTNPAEVTRSVIGISSCEGDELCLYTRSNPLFISKRAFEGMPNLQFLRISGNLKYITIIPSWTSLQDHLKYISPKLQLLDWSYARLTNLSFMVHTEILVELTMRHSNLQELWEGIKPLPNLKWIDLSYSKDLMRLPNLSSATNLQILKLRDCFYLRDFAFIENATNLQHLDLSGCPRIENILFSITDATNLQTLNLSGCRSLRELPSFIGNASNLQQLYLCGCSNLVELPSSIGNATNLQKLYVDGCSSLVEFPSSITDATNLRKINLSGCTSLQKLPSSIGNASNLRKLNLSGCFSLKELPFSIGNATNLQKLYLSGCSSLMKLPSSLENLHGVTIRPPY